jgi:hypothetical protein
MLGWAMWLRSFGELWCARAEGATYSDPPDEVSIAHPDGSAPEGCLCIPLGSPVHDWIDAHETGGRVVIERNVVRLELGVEHPLIDLLLGARDAIYDEAVRACIRLVPPSAASNTCGHPSRFDVVPATPAFEPREVDRGTREGEVDCVWPSSGVASSVLRPADEAQVIVRTPPGTTRP